MKRFLVPVIILAAISWGIWLSLLNFSSPFVSTNYNELLLITTNYNKVFPFLASLFFALLFTFALALYSFYRSFGDYAQERTTLRRSLRQNFFVSLGVITLAVLQLTSTLNLLTIILTAAVAIALELTFRATK